VGIKIYSLVKQNARNTAKKRYKKLSNLHAYYVYFARIRLNTTLTGERKGSIADLLGKVHSSGVPLAVKRRMESQFQMYAAVIGGNLKVVTKKGWLIAY